MEQVDQKKSLSQQLHDKASKISIGYDIEAHDKHYALLFLGPSLLILSVFVFYPMIKTVWMSFFLTNSLGKPTVFVGLQNYIDLFTSSAYLNSKSHVHLRFVRVDSDDCLGIAFGTNRKCQTEGHRLFQNRLFFHDGRVRFRCRHLLAVHFQSFGRIVEQDCRISSSAGGQLADSAWLGNVCHHRFDRLDESRVYVFDLVRSIAVGAGDAL